jgi:NAD(P)-dependent dehydrogenase (short-subunit alcohol dehydrogenase family)
MTSEAVVIVGATTAIGTACAWWFGGRGAAIIAVDTDAGELEQLAEQLESNGIRTLVHVTDVVDGPERLARECDLADVGVTALVAATMQLDWAPIATATADEWRTAFESNVVAAVIYGTRMLPVLGRAEDGAIVLIGSIDGTLGNPQIPMYSVTKGCITPLTHVLSHEGALHGVRANAIAIGGVLPKGVVPESDSRIAAVVELTPSGRLADPAEIAAVAGFLCSAPAAYVNGTVVTVDGGRSGLTPGTTLLPQAD